MENKENNEPKINIFNEDVNNWGEKEELKKKHKEECCKHCHKSGKSIWGLILLFVGVFLLLNNMGIVSSDIWYFILPFWPVILVLIGIKIILGKSQISSWISFVIALVLLGAILMNAMMQLNSRNIFRFNGMGMGHFNSFYIINK